MFSMLIVAFSLFQIGIVIGQCQDRNELYIPPKEQPFGGSSSRIYCPGFNGGLVGCGRSCQCNEFPSCKTTPQMCCDKGVCVCKPGYWRADSGCISYSQCESLHRQGPVPAVASSSDFRSPRPIDYDDDEKMI